MDSDLMRLKETADYLKIAKVTLARWYKLGKIPFHKVGRVIFFSKNEVDEAVFGHKKN